MRGLLRFCFRLAILIAVIWAVRRFLVPEAGVDRAALARGEARARTWLDGAKAHVDQAVADGREAAATARRTMESEAGAALSRPEDQRRPEDPDI